MSDASRGPGWWEASDGKWYPPDSHPDHEISAKPPGPPPGAPSESPGPSRPTRPARSKPLGRPSRVAWLVLAIIGIALVVVIVVVGGGDDDGPEPADSTAETDEPATAPADATGDEQAINEIADAVVEGFADDEATVERSEAVCLASALVSELGADRARQLSDRLSEDQDPLEDADAGIVARGYRSCLPMRDLIRQGFLTEGIAADGADCLTELTMAKLDQVMTLTLAGRLEELTQLTAPDRAACGVG